mgnify:CR=1 FL=1
MPETYVFPPDRRPGKHIPSCKDSPTIDLKKAAGLERTEVIEQIMKASQEFLDSFMFVVLVMFELKN